MKKGLRGLAVLSVCLVSVIVALPSFLQAECLDVEGTWNYYESATITCSAAGESETMHPTGSGSVFINQDGCSISYAVPGSSYSRTGSITGNTVQVSGPMVVPLVEGVNITRNTFTASGTTNYETTNMVLNGSGSARGSYEGVSFVCTGTSQVTFNRQIYRTLSITKSGAGYGTVSSSPSGIYCGGTCSASYTYGTAVTLTGTADSGSYFTGWGSPCSGNGTCALSMTSDRAVTATFNPAGDPFLDVVPGVWSEGYIKTIYDAHITAGYGGTGEFKPGYNVTREQMAAFLVRAVEGEPGACSTAPFDDVPVTSWACPYIKRLAELGITSGYGGTPEFKPGYDVTREQMAAFIARAFLGAE